MNAERLDALLTLARGLNTSTTADMSSAWHAREDQLKATMLASFERDFGVDLADDHDRNAVIAGLALAFETAALMVRHGSGPGLVAERVGDALLAVVDRVSVEAGQ